MKRHFTFISLLLGLLLSVSMQGQTVAIVVDGITLQKVEAEIKEYMQAINRDGKRTVLIEDKWQHPDSIRKALKELYKSDKFLEGAVLIGDIPVAMLRDAQHFTTAFKMNQSNDWKASSVPSDRFYDDFGLEFDYLRQDSTEHLYHYYSLSARSKQYLSSDIYSARIKPPVVPGKDKYQLIADYLRKVVNERGARRELSNILVYAGHGYNSDSFSARIDDGWALKHHFPSLGSVRGKGWDFINFNAATVKERLMAKLADPTLDLALLHHHGSDDVQFLSSTPPPVATLQAYMEYAQRLLRSNLRKAKDTTDYKAQQIERGLPEQWFEGAFDPDIRKNDSIFSAAMDLMITDTYDRLFHARFVMFDACFNGSFHLDDYLSGHYVFNPGQTIVTKANSVNVLQDNWPHELIGLLDEGVCVGNWLRELFTLESHIIGDPTFRFSSGNTTLDRDMVREKNHPAYWRKMLKRSSKTELRSVALVMLQKNRAITSEELLGILKDDSNPVVRMEAFTLLTKRRSPLMPQAIELAVTDTYELLQRMGMLAASKSGHPSLLPLIVKRYFDPATSIRVAFHLRQAIELYPESDVRNLLERYRQENPLWPTEVAYTAYLEQLQRGYLSRKKDFAQLNRNTIAAQRNLCHTQYLNELFDYLKTGNDNVLRVLVAETFGWYVHSWQRDTILAFCQQQLSEEKDAAVKNELQKTIGRLSVKF